MHWMLLKYALLVERVFSPNHTDLLLVFVTSFFPWKDQVDFCYYCITDIYGTMAYYCFWSSCLLLQGSSDEFIDANIQLALVVARKLKELKGTRSCIVSSSFICQPSCKYALQMQNHAHLLSSSWFQVFPDQPEKRRASQLFRTAIDTVNDDSWNNIF